MRPLEFAYMVVKLKENGLYRGAVAGAVETAVCNALRNLAFVSTRFTSKRVFVRLVGEVWSEKVAEALVDYIETLEAPEFSTGSSDEKICGFIINFAGATGQWKGPQRERLERHLLTIYKKTPYIMREYLSHLPHHSRSPLLEKTLVNEPELAAYYAVHVIRGRWPEAEAAINADPLAKRFYTINREIRD